MNTDLNVELAPNCVEIGMRACRRGDFSTARQMLRMAIDQLTFCPINTSETHSNAESQITLANGGADTISKDYSTADNRLFDLMISVADTYLNEGNYEQAKHLYESTEKRLADAKSETTINYASVMLRLASVSVLQNNMTAFHKYFAKSERAYLMTKEADATSMLNALVDLSWVLSTHGHVNEVLPVNNLILQIKQIHKESNYNIFG